MECQMSVVIFMFCLHYVFKPHIQEDLSLWWNAGNNHGLRTESYKSPKQLWYLVVFYINILNTLLWTIFSDKQIKTGSSNFQILKVRTVGMSH